MGEIIKDYTINEIKQGIEKDMAFEMSKKKYLRGHDLQQQAYNRRIKVQNNIVNIYNNLVNHRKIGKDTEKKFQQLQIKYANLRDRELPLIARVEFSYVTSLQTKRAAIEKFATKLDTYEDEVLKLLRPLVQLKNEENQFFEGNVDKEDSNLDNVCGPHLKFYIKGQDIKDKSLVLNESTNPVPIHKILQESSINKGDVRKIDYSGCTNKSIKDKMINCLGGKEYCYISYSDKTKTYNLFDKEGKLLSQRAYIREGVKLFPPYLLKWEGRQKAKEKAEKAAINKMKNLSPNKEKELLGRIPEKLKNKLTEAQQKEFIKYTENILNSTVLSARKNGEQLSGEPIKMTNFEGIKLCTTTTQNRYWRDIHPNKYYNISEDLNKILNENERHVLTYLNIRVHEKWNDASDFANRDIVNIEPKEENDKIVTSEEIQNFENGINELLGLLSNYKMRVVPDFFARNAYDKPVADLEIYLNNLISTLESGIFNKSLIKQAEKDISDKLKECGFVHDGPKNSGRTIEDFVKIMLESEGKERQLALRNLGETSNRMGHDTSLSSDQLRSTAINMDNIKIKEEEYNESLQKIKIYFSIGENDSVDGNNKCQAAKNIDILYSCTSSKHLFEFFRKNKLVPAQCDYSDFKDVCENIFKKIESDNKLIEEKESELRNNCKGRLDDKYNEVLAKEHKDEEDISFLNKYELLSSPDGKQALDEMIDKIIPSVANSIKYLNTVSFLNGTLGLQLARLGGGLDKTGLSGIDLNIVEEFNDSIGEGGRFNKSDEGLELTINIATEVIKEVIICLIVMVLTDGVGVPARIASKLPKWGLKITNRILKGVAFHVASTLIHNTIDVINGDKVLSEMGEGLDDRKGYATSVIFFAVMELVPIGVGKIHTKFSKNKVLETLKNLERAGKLPEGKTAEMIAKDLEGNIKGTMELVTSDMGPLCKGLTNLGVSTELFVTELTSMLLAEQIGSLLTEGGFHNPTPEEIAQTIGMILAFKGIGRIKKIIKGNKGEKIFQIEKSNSKTIEISENELNGILDEFDSKIMSKEGITVDGHTYRLEYRNNTSKNSNKKGDKNSNKKGEFVRTVDGKTICTAKSENSKVLPDNSKGNSIRKLFNSVREKYLSNKLGASNTRIRKGLEKDLSSNIVSEKDIELRKKDIESKTKDIDSKTRELEGKRNNKNKFEIIRKKLLNEINGLKARKSQLEHDLQNTPKEITIQPQTVSLKDILNVFFTRAGKSVSIGGIKCEFVKVENGKIYFTKFKKPFSSFKELKDAGIRFDIDINVKQERNRTEKTYEKQQQIFDELVRAEEKAAEIARNANNIIREYKELSNKRDQIKSELETNSYFRENAHKLAGEKVWINGTEYKISLTEEGLLRFVEAKGQGDFTISSFKELANKGQVNGFSDGVRSHYNGKEIIREKIEGAESLKPHEKEIHELLYGEEGNPNKPGLIKGEDNYINSRKQDLQDINELLEIGKADYENAVASTTSRKVTNPEYERVQKEIDGIDSQITSKKEDLAKVEKDLGTSETEIAAIEKEINELTTERDKLSEDNKGNNKKEQEEQKRKQQEEKEKQRQEDQERKQKEEQERKQKEEQKRKQQEEQERKQREEQQRIEQDSHGESEEIVDVGRGIEYPENTFLKNGIKMECNMEIKYEGEFYENGVLKKGKKYLENGLICEMGEYDINGKMIKGEKYQYDADIYSHEGMPINGVKTTEYVGDGHIIVSKKGKINQLGDYLEGRNFEYKYKDGSKFVGTLDNANKPLQGEWISPDGTISRKGEFNNGILKKGIEISNSRNIKFIGDVGKDFIIREMNLIEENIGIGDTITIGLQDGTILKIQNINGDLMEIVQCRGNHQILNPIEKGKLGEYVNRRMEDITVYYEVVVDQLERFLKKHEIINEHGIRTHEEGTMRELQKKLEGYSSEELNEIVEHSTGDVQHQAYRILEIRQNGSAGSNVLSTTSELNQIFEDFRNFEVNDYATLHIDGKFTFKPDFISKDFRGKKYATINGKKYRIFENGKGKGFGCMLGSRGGASRSWGGEYDIQIGNFKNGLLEGEGIRITKGFREEGIFKNGQLEGNGKVYKNNHLLYEGEFKNGVYNGKGKEYDANGTIVYEGEFKNGNRLNKTPEVSNKRINTERKEMSDVYRETDVVAIGDLHGEYAALKGNMEFAGLAKEVNGHLEWTGGNKKVVFQGDILADRGTDGLRIIQEIHQLREQARKQGGDIDIIVGNHDDFMISYLTNRNGIHGNGFNVSYSYGMQGKGLIEILKYIGIKPTGEFSDFGYLKGRNIEILNSMRNSKEGRIILEEICNMKVITQVDDVLYCHTNPTKEMLEYLTNGNVQDNINLINNNYQGYLRSVLLGEGTPPIDTGGFNKISDIFLDTNNRHGMMGGIEQYCNKLKNSGINMISHGHNGGDGYRSTEIGGVKIVDTDHTFMKKGEYGDGHSVSIVKKEGGVNYIGDNVAYANIEYPIGTEVYVKRSAGGESKAKVDSYDPTTKMYKVIWKEGGQILSKEVMSEDLRGVDSQINIAA